MALTAMLTKVPAQFRAMAAMLLSMVGYARDEWAVPAAEAVPGEGRIHRAAQVGTIITVVIIATVALVGTLILARIDSALPDIANDQLSNSSTAVLDGFAGAMQLVPVVLLVLIAALVIGVVQRMRMRS
jgi:flagellar biosynthesis protein FlhB